MPTVIDALTVALSLDATGFTKGQKTATTAFGKTKDEAVKAGKSIEGASEKAAESLEKIARNALKLFAIFTAGRAVKDFVADITSADSALGRLAQRIGQSPSTVSAFGNAVERMGGNAATAQASLEKFTDQMAVLKRSGQYGGFDEISRLIGRSGVGINLFNKDATQTLGQISDALKSVKDKYGAVEAYSFGKGLGFDEGTIALLIKGSAAMRAATEESKRIGVANKADTDAAQNFQTSIRTLEQAMTSLGRSVMTQVTPTLVNLLKYFQDVITANREWINTNIVQAVKDFATWLKSIDWKAVVDGVREFGKGTDAVVKGIGGWKVAAEAFFALWAASKMVSLFAPLFGQIALLRATLVGMGPIGWSLLGLGTLAGILAQNADKGIVSGGKPKATLNPGDELPGVSTAPNERGGAGIRFRGSRGSARTGDMMRYAMDQLRAEGVPEANLRQAAAHLVGQATMESGLDPNKVHDGGTGYGIYGARLGRRSRMLAWLSAHGYAPNSAEGQQRYMAHEAMTDPTYAVTRRILMGQGSGNVGTDTNTITGNFERPAINNNRSGAVRGAYGTGPSAVPGPTSWNGIPAAAGFVEQAKMAQAANAARVSNDNRSNIDQSSQTTIGDVHVHTNASDADGIARDMQGAMRRRSFAMSANYGQA